MNQDTHDNIKRQINLHQRRLAFLKEKKAMRGYDTPPDILMEIEDIQNTIDELSSELNQLDISVNYSSPRAIQIYLHGDFNSVSNEKQYEAVQSLAAIMGIPPQ